MNNHRGTKMNLHTVKCFAKAIVCGSKYVYQTVPRLLTIWLDMGENVTAANTDVFRKLNHSVAIAIKTAPVYKVSLPYDSDFTQVSSTCSGLPLSLKLCLVSAIKTTRSIMPYQH
jgi:serine/threonine-protein kinase ATR